ncbi:MAG: Eukaryotic peptide chain release factor GTP-binding subunit [Chrysothrix sp. TS-e1954]|nr:MAG: Eukaryotic peptide chain release factor GTP-binding subunit [Chrysothrix sp. TS-e1954]
MAQPRPTSFPNYHASFPAAPAGQNEETETVISSEGGIDDTANASRSNHASSRNPSEPLGSTGPVGEPGLPPARPITLARAVDTSYQVQENETVPPLPPVPTSPTKATSKRESVGSLDLRPSTAGSRTHVPSVSSRAFMTPMSSQRLQAQRGARPISPLVSRLPQSDEDYDDDDRSRTGSVLSPVANRSSRFRDELAAQPQSSPEDQQSEWEPDETTKPDPVAYGRFDPVDGPEQSLDSLPQHRNQLRSDQDPGSTVTGSTPHVFGNGFAGGNVDPPQDSPRSTNGHEKLSSTDSSSHIRSMKDKVKPNLGGNWEYFQGNTVFCWGGRLQTARDRPVSALTALLILIPAGLFFGFSAPFLWRHVSPAIPILFAYVFLVCASSFIHAAFSDPGIIPRNLHPMPPANPQADPMDVGPAMTEWIFVKSSAARNGAYEVPTKYCKSCNLWRPPRCHHCRVCDNCIETQDHHCVWLNNCVGRRNYRYFFTFVASACILATFLWTASLGHIIAFHREHHQTFNDAIDSNRVPFAMFIYGLIAFVYPLSLSGYHMGLLYHGHTTREYLNSKKFRKIDRHRPFAQKRWWHNFVVVLIRARSPTSLNFKKKYEEGDQRFGARRGKRTRPLAPHQQNGGTEMRNLGVPNSTFQGPMSSAPMDWTPRPEFDAVRKRS